MSAAIARKLAAAGLDAAAIVAALEAFEQAEEERKAVVRERKRRQRERDVTGQNVTSRDIAGQDVTPAPSLPSPPDPPNQPTPTRECETSRPRKGGEPEGFERFWAAYPLKVGKPKAKAAYVKALTRIDGPDPPGVIVAGVEAHRPKWELTEPEFLPHPTTWLNRDGWNDEPLPPRRSVVVPFNERPSPADRKQADRTANNARHLSGAQLAAELRAKRDSGW